MKLASVDFTIGVGEDSIPLHLVVHPVSVVGFSIGPEVLAFALNRIIFELTGIHSLVCPGKSPIPLFRLLNVLSE